MKPPIKALEAIKKYCEKTQCRKCEFGVREHLNDVEYVGCELQMQTPCDWEGEENESDNLEKINLR